MLELTLDSQSIKTSSVVQCILSFYLSLSDLRATNLRTIQHQNLRQFTNIQPESQFYWFL